MNKPLLMLPMLCVLPALQSCMSHTGSQTAWKIQPVLTVHNSFESADGYYQLGRFYQGQNRHEQAIQAFQKALAINAKYAPAHNAIGVSHAAQGKLDLAVNQFYAAIALDPNTAYYYNNLGYVHYLKQDYALAANELKEAVRLDPNAERSVNNYKLALAQSQTAAPQKANDSAAVAAAPAQPAASSPALNSAIAAQAPRPAAPQPEMPASKAAAISEAMPKPVAMQTAAPPAAKPEPTVAAMVEAEAPAMPEPSVKMEASAQPESSIKMEASAKPEPSDQMVASAKPSSSIKIETSAQAAPAAAAETTAKAEPVPATTAPVLSTTVAQRSSQEPSRYATSSAYHLEIANGNGVTGMARKVRKELAVLDVPKARLTNQKPFRQTRTLVQYREGYKAQAELLSASLPNTPPTRPAMYLRASTDVRLVLGKDVARTGIALRKHQPTTTKLALNQKAPEPASTK
jgi:Flp pilus assembly protein TadD